MNQRDLLFSDFKALKERMLGSRNNNQDLHLRTEKGSGFLKAAIEAKYKKSKCKDSMQGDQKAFVPDQDYYQGTDNRITPKGNEYILNKIITTKPKKTILDDDRLKKQDVNLLIENRSTKKDQRASSSELDQFGFEFMSKGLNGYLGELELFKCLTHRDREEDRTAVNEVKRVTKRPPLKTLVEHRSFAEGHLGSTVRNFRNEEELVVENRLETDRDNNENRIKNKPYQQNKKQKELRKEVDSLNGLCFLTKGDENRYSENKSASERPAINIKKFLTPRPYLPEPGPEQTKHNVSLENTQQSFRVPGRPNTARSSMELIENIHVETFITKVDQLNSHRTSRKVADNTNKNLMSFFNQEINPQQKTFTITSPQATQGTLKELSLSLNHQESFRKTVGEDLKAVAAAKESSKIRSHTPNPTNKSANSNRTDLGSPSHKPLTLLLSEFKACTKVNSRNTENENPKIALRDGYSETFRSHHITQKGIADKKNKRVKTKRPLSLEHKTQSIKEPKQEAVSNLNKLLYTREKEEPIYVTPKAQSKNTSSASPASLYKQASKSVSVEEILTNNKSVFNLIKENNISPITIRTTRHRSSKGSRQVVSSKNRPKSLPNDIDPKRFWPSSARCFSPPEKIKRSPKTARAGKREERTNFFGESSQTEARHSKQFMRTKNQESLQIFGRNLESLKGEIRITELDESSFEGSRKKPKKERSKLLSDIAKSELEKLDLASQISSRRNIQSQLRVEDTFKPLLRPNLSDLKLKFKLGLPQHEGNMRSKTPSSIEIKRAIHNIELDSARTTQNKELNSCKSSIKRLEFDAIRRNIKLKVNHSRPLSEIFEKPGSGKEKIYQLSSRNKDSLEKNIKNMSGETNNLRRTKTPQKLAKNKALELKVD